MAFLDHFIPSVNAERERENCLVVETKHVTVFFSVNAKAAFFVPADSFNLFPLKCAIETVGSKRVSISTQMHRDCSVIKFSCFAISRKEFMSFTKLKYIVSVDSLLVLN